MVFERKMYLEKLISAYYVGQINTLPYLTQEILLKIYCKIIIFFK